MTRRGRLGDREMDILQVLWQRGEATVSDVQEALRGAGHDVAYTTIQTMLNRLEVKGHVRRNNDERAHRYLPLLTENATLRQAIRRLAQRFFAGSPEEMAVHLVQNNLSPTQLDRLQKMIARRKKDLGT